MPETQDRPIVPRKTMTQFRRKDRTIEAITFDELVEYGKAQGVPLTNGMPWSFSFNGHPITHKNDDCYLIPAPGLTMRFNRGDMLVVEADRIYPLRRDTFDYFYESNEPTKASREMLGI